MTTPSAAALAPFSAERWQQFWDAWKAEPRQLAGRTEAAPWRQNFSSAPPAPVINAPLGATLLSPIAEGASFGQAALASGTGPVARELAP